RMVREEEYPTDGRVVQVLVADGGDAAGVQLLRDELLSAAVAVHVVAPHKGAIAGADGLELTVDRSFLTSCAAECDALVVADAGALLDDPGVVSYVQEAYRHHKPVGAWGSGVDLLRQAGIGTDQPGVAVSARGATKTFAKAVVTGLARHRHWERAPLLVLTAPRAGSEQA